MLMKTLRPLLAAIACAAAPGLAQAFTNLDFEAASVVPIDPESGFAFLDWAQAAPGWSHSEGADTAVVYYGTVHTGLTQWFLLSDAALSSNGQYGSALQGRFSLSFVSGHAWSEPDSPWVQAFASQVGTVPVGTQSLRLLAQGPLELRIDDQLLELQALGGNAFAADVSAWAGQTVELRLQNSSGDFDAIVTVDGIDFSPLPVPEPSTVLYLAAGSLLVAARVRRRGD